MLAGHVGKSVVFVYSDQRWLSKLTSDFNVSS